MRSLLPGAALLALSGLPGSHASCNSVHGCVACTETKTWSGDPCRFCPKDDACHAKGSVLNPCAANENKVDPTQCGSEAPAFDPARASGLYFILSAAAYSDDPKGCLASNDPGLFAGLASVEGDHVRDPTNNDTVYLGVTAAVVPADNAVVVAFRGTQSNTTQLQWEAFYNLLLPKAPLTLDPAGTVNVQVYFLAAFEALQPWVEGYLRAHWNPGMRIVFAGHSLGGAIASVASLYFSVANVNGLPVAGWGGAPVLYTYGQPRVGDYGYAKTHDQYVRNAWRVTHEADLVPHIPWCSHLSVAHVQLCNAITEPTWPYHHGTEVFYGPMNTMANVTDYKVCHGVPINEDKLCSNMYPWPVMLANGIDEHVCYYGKLVGSYCAKGRAGSSCNT